MHRPTRLLILAIAICWTLAGAHDARADATEITVYKSPTCGCCNGWIDHLEAAGFKVEAYDTRKMSAIKRDRGLPEELGSCHTAEVGGYLVEGHVPAEDIKRLLETKPDVAGLAVPGMPIGSPGMEGPNPERYDVLEFKRDGSTAVFATHGPESAETPSHDHGGH